MYAGQRGMPNAGPRSSPFKEEGQRGAQPGSEHGATQPQPQPPSSQGGFGSPAPFYNRARPGAENGGAGMAGKRPPIQQHAFQAGNLPRYSLAPRCISFLSICPSLRLLLRFLIFLA